MKKTLLAKIRVDEHYGDVLIPLTFPDGWNIEEVKIACKDEPPLNDDKIRSALNDPVGSPDITEQARGKTGRIIITCDDLSRPTPAAREEDSLSKYANNRGNCLS